MIATIKDVAKRANVAPSTVTRVIQDSKSISQATKDRVKEAMRELDYHPNLNARSLVSNKSNVIGLVLPNATDEFYQNPFFPTALRGLNDFAIESGYSILIITGKTIEDRIKNVETTVRGGRVDGLIFLYSIEKDPIIARVNQLDFPYVVIGKPDNLKINFVDNENDRGSYEGTEYLIKNGAKRIAFIGGEAHAGFIVDRLEGYKSALQDYGMTYRPEDVFNDITYLPEEGYRMSKEIFKLGHFDAALIADQLVAEAFIIGWKELSDEKFNVMTFKAYQSSNLTSEEEAYIDINARELGRASFKILMTVLKEKNKTTKRFYHEFVPHKLVIHK